ncbi:MAG TPA: VCBS repeat-containing protein [Rhodothermales bacterium]|nr:VCBS repeat-containing protein [Rhodothermales bacterium]
MAVILFAGASCGPQRGPAELDGASLARAYCSRCHAFPEPELLSRHVWVNSVLPAMGAFMGMYTKTARYSLIEPLTAFGINADSVYPTRPQISKERWGAIVSYYEHAAPDSLVDPPRAVPVSVGLPYFKVDVPPGRFEPPYTTAVRIDAAHGRLFVGNYATKNALVAFDPKLDPLHRYDLDGDPVAVRVVGDRVLVAVVGKGPEPTDASAGSLQVIEGPNGSPRRLISKLRRPVDFALGDLNSDGREDFVICEYGNRTGFLSWYEGLEGGGYRRHVLSRQSGAVRLALHDFDRDGRTDVGVLMAQGDEGFDIYYNRGAGRFEQRRVLRFPPVYGSNDFDLADFNGDGVTDILYAAGDNADLSTIPKPYHGVRIFLGDGEGGYSERYFFPLNGSTRVRAADFDGDGDLDISAAAYFPDYARTPEESFVYLENEGGFTFKPYTFEDSYRGRWMALDVGDIDGDGDPDILLGSNIAMGPLGDKTGLYNRWRKDAPSFLVLENTTTATTPARQQPAL